MPVLRVKSLLLLTIHPACMCRIHASHTMQDSMGVSYAHCCPLQLLHSLPLLVLLVPQVGCLSLQLLYLLLSLVQLMLPGSNLLQGTAQSSNRIGVVAVVPCIEHAHTAGTLGLQVLLMLQIGCSSV